MARVDQNRPSDIIAGPRVRGLVLHRAKACAKVVRMSDTVSPPPGPPGPPAGRATGPRVLHLITDPRLRGAQNLARDLHAELLRRGWDSRLVALQPHPDSPPDRTGPPVLGPSRFHPTTLAGLRRAAAGADLVIAHGSSTLPACALALVGGPPFVYVNIGDPRSWTAGWSRRARVGVFLRRAVAVAAISDGARQVLIERFGLDPGRVRTLTNAREAHRYPPEPDPGRRLAARQRLGLPAQGLLVAVVGALTTEKRIDLAIDAIGRVPGVRLAIAGEGPLRGPLEAAALALAADRVHFLGALPSPLELYHAADALLLSSDSEGVPGVLIEAALAGLPCVATDVGWVRDVVQDGVTGALVPPGDPQALADALDRVLSGAPALGAAARLHALDRFELGVVVDAWEEFLRDLVPAADRSKS